MEEKIKRSKRLSAAWITVYQRCSGWMDWVMQALAGKHTELDGDFDANADWAIAEQTPKGARILVWLSVAAVLVLLLWSAFAVLDEVTRGEGKVIPSRQVQVMQSLDGGIVSEILVKEGQSVKVGDLLLKVDPTRMVSSLRENRSQYLSLLAKAARLRALAEGSRFLPPDEVTKEAPEIVEQERALYESRRAELDATIGVARQQSSQRSQELISIRAKREQAAQSYNLTARELEMTRPLAKTGAISDVELLRLERDVARYRGERDSANADIPRLESAVAESARKIQEIELTFRNIARSELSEANAKLNALSEGSTALEDRALARAQEPHRRDAERSARERRGGGLERGRRRTGLREQIAGARRRHLLGHDGRAVGGDEERRREERVGAEVLGIGWVHDDARRKPGGRGEERATRAAAQAERIERREPVEDADPANGSRIDVFRMDRIAQREVHVDLAGVEDHHSRPVRDEVSLVIAPREDARQQRAPVRVGPGAGPREDAQIGRAADRRGHPRGRRGARRGRRSQDGRRAAARHARNEQRRERDDRAHRHDAPERRGVVHEPTDRVPRDHGVCKVNEAAERDRGGSSAYDCTMRCLRRVACLALSLAPIAALAWPRRRSSRWRTRTPASSCRRSCR